ncbi:centromere protein C [Eublepharis macularius]|uniref:Centromere protein C n=1 Tax=Eublepharis macularius TaxID=481883 RepID=A0AA97K0N5_EUBMA|nr:centromere protein C [Eublepharis macularius]
MFAQEYPVLRQSLSPSSSSPDLNQDNFLSPCDQKTSSYLVNAVRRSAFSANCPEAQPREVSHSGDNGSPINPLDEDEDEMFLGSPALLIEEQKAPTDMGSVPQRALPSLSSNTVALESENQDEFLIAESFGGPSASWLSEPRGKRAPMRRRVTSPRLESGTATKQRGIENAHCGDQIPAVEQRGSLSKQPPSIVPTAQWSPPRGQEKSPRNAPLNEQAESKRKNMQSSVRSAGRKHRVPVSEESVENESRELRSEWAGEPRGGGLTGSEKRTGRAGKATVVSPGYEGGGVLPPEGSCEAEKILSSTERQSSWTPSVQCSSLRAINMKDLSGPVCSQNDKAYFEREMMIRSNRESFSESASEEDSALLASDSLKEKGTCLRRSKRLRLKPLEYWRGQRVKYKTRPSGGLVVSGIISPAPKEHHKLKRAKNPMKMDLGTILGNAIKDNSQPACVFDAASQQVVLEKCVSSSHSHVLFFSNEALSVYKYLSTPLFSAGKMILKPFKEKGFQYSHTDTLVFNVVKGRLLFTLYDHCYSLCTGDYFYVPAGNAYNVQNISDEECILFFTQIKGSRPEGE